MNNHRKLIAVLCVGLFMQAASGHDRSVHRAITSSASESAFDNSPAYASFVNTVSADLAYTGLNGATNLMVEGSAAEDSVHLTEVRVYSHFYDPLDPTFGKGLSDAPPDIRCKIGLNSFTWASTRDCVAWPFAGLFGLLGNIGDVNHNSWQNARDKEWNGLTASSQSDRQAALSDMFTDLGHVMHLLEDTTSPQHVRNEQHIPPVWSSHIEAWGKDHADSLNYQPGMLDWRGDGFTKLEDFWDRHLYNGSSAALDNAEADGGTQLGLAEWCNGNFLGERHKYAEFYNQTSIKYYPFPSLKNTTQPQLKPGNLAGTVIDSITLRNHKTGDRVYISKTGAGVPVTHHSALNYLAVQNTPRLGGPQMQVGLTIHDDNVLSNYHDIFIPKAVEYSAGILDYFFRGTFFNRPTRSSDFQFYTNTVINTSGQDFCGGSFYLIEESNGVRTVLQQFPVSNTLPVYGVSNFIYSGPITTTNKHFLVYQGTIGVTNRQALDPVDAGIAIAIAKPVPDHITATANPLWTDSGIAVTSGQTLAISASGTWSWAEWCDADGVNDGCTDVFLAGANHGSLIAYVGTHPPYEDSTGTDRWGDTTYFPKPAGNGYWLAGKNATITTDRTGELWFLINDDAVSESIGDNSGVLSVRVQIQ